MAEKPPYAEAEEFLAIARALGSPEQLRRRCYMFDEMIRERREYRKRFAALDAIIEQRASPEYLAKQAAIDAMIEDRKGQQWFGTRSKRAAMVASGIIAFFVAVMQTMTWIRDMMGPR